jgi:predicted Zn-dependent protease
MRKIIILLISVVCFSIQVSASSIIRDSEIEEVIKEISEPVIKAAKINDVKIYLVQDDSFNAFTTLGNRIYIFSGLINQMPYIDVLPMNSAILPEDI